MWTLNKHSTNIEHIADSTTQNPIRDLTPRTASVAEKGYEYTYLCGVHSSLQYGIVVIQKPTGGMGYVLKHMECR